MLKEITDICPFSQKCSNVITVNQTVKTVNQNQGKSWSQSSEITNEKSKWTKLFYNTFTLVLWTLYL